MIINSWYLFIHKNKRPALCERLWWFCKQRFDKPLPGLCFADHSVCWIHAEKQKWSEKMSDQSVHSLLFPHRTEHIYLIAASDTHHLKNTCESARASNLTNISLTCAGEWMHYFCCSNKISPHEAKRECVGEDKASIAHTHLPAQRPKTTPRLPKLKRCQGLVSCQ